MSVKRTVDLSIFEHKESKCNANVADISKIVSHCDHLLRIANALKYYQLLVSSDNSRGRDVFIEFCVETYPMCLEDYIHLISVHSDALPQIQIDLKQNYNFKSCEVMSQCNWTQRHYRNRHMRNDKLNKQENKQEFNFYIDIFDTMHFYLFHLEQIGLRSSVKHHNDIKLTDIKQDVEDLYDEKYDADAYLNCVDEKFGDIQKEIENKTKKSGLDINRFNKVANSKFHIMVIQQYDNREEHKSDVDKKQPKKKKKGNILKKMQKKMNKFFGHNKTGSVAGKLSIAGTLGIAGRVSIVGNDKIFTFRDDIFDHIQNETYIDFNKINSLKQYVLDEEFDTDCIVDDIDNNYGNISNVINSDTECVAVIYSFIRDYNISSHLFSTGIVFWYWKYYRKLNDQQYKQQQSLWNQNDFGGHCIADLYVEKYYKSLKAEALNSGYIINSNQFDRLVIDKGNRYIDTEKFRKIKCVIIWDLLHFGIQEDESLSNQHIYALVLYTDFTAFSTNFSSTFRPTKWNESLSSIKSRNRKYYHMSRYLRELVQYYGVKGGSLKHNENGPFFTGMSFVMNISSFAIRLNGPTSTSKIIQIAMRFSGDDGIIIQLNNRTGAGVNERFFNCSWISNYPEEEERIFCGGWFKLEIESIRNMSTTQNYAPFIASFYLFDSMLSGSFPTETKVKARDIDIIHKSITHYLGSMPNTFGDYINDTFYSFCQAKTQIILNLYQMEHRIVQIHTAQSEIHTAQSEIDIKRKKVVQKRKNKKFVNLIMHSIQKEKLDQSQQTGQFGDDDEEYKEWDDNYRNLFKPSMFELFPNIKEIIMYVSHKTINGDFIYSFDIYKLLSNINALLLPKSFERIIIKDVHRLILNKIWGLAIGIKESFALRKLIIDFKEEQGEDEDEDWLLIHMDKDKVDEIKKLKSIASTILEDNHMEENDQDSDADSEVP